MPSLWPEGCLAAQKVGICHWDGFAVHTGQPCSLHLIQNPSAAAPRRLHHLRPCKDALHWFERNANCPSVKRADPWCRLVGWWWKIQKRYWNTHDTNSLNVCSCPNRISWSKQLIRWQPQGHYMDLETSGPQAQPAAWKAKFILLQRGLLICCRKQSQWYKSDAAIPPPVQNFGYACQFLSQAVPASADHLTHASVSESLPC